VRCPVQQIPFDFAQGRLSRKTALRNDEVGLAAIMSMSSENLPAPLPTTAGRRRALGKNLWLAAAIGRTTMMLIHAAPCDDGNRAHAGLSSHSADHPRSRFQPEESCKVAKSRTVRRQLLREMSFLNATRLRREIVTGTRRPFRSH